MKPSDAIRKLWEWSAEDDLFSATIGGSRFLLIKPDDGSPWCAEECLTQECLWGTRDECNDWVLSRITAHRDELNRIIGGEG